MNGNIRSFLSNFTYAFSSNFISLFVSTLVILIIPKLISVEDYGYWQLFLFYSSFVGFLHFGWNDGIYLRYGGAEYGELNKLLFHSQFIMQLASQVFIAVIIVILTDLYIGDSNRDFILKMIALTLVVVNIRVMLQYILQSTNRMKEYAKSVMADRILYVVLLLVLILFGIRDIKLFIVADVIAKVISLLFAMYSCKEIVFFKLNGFYFTIREMMTNVSVGINLMFANIASMLIIGIVRFGIERTWDVATFGKISMMLNISSAIMIFINSLGIILFPLLRRTDQENLPNIYLVMRDVLMIFLLGMLVVYYPLKIAMSYWLPQYADSLIYLAFVFPIFIYEGKMALLINTYLKTLRKEKKMLQVNLISTVLSLILTLFATQLAQSLEFAIINIIILLAIRAVLAEILLSKVLAIKVKRDNLLEILLTALFVIFAATLHSWTMMVGYLLAYFTYLLIKRDNIKVTFNYVKKLMKV